MALAAEHAPKVAGGSWGLIKVCTAQWKANGRMACSGQSKSMAGLVVALPNLLLRRSCSGNVLSVRELLQSSRRDSETYACKSEGSVSGRVNADVLLWRVGGIERVTDTHRLHMIQI